MKDDIRSIFANDFMLLSMWRKWRFSFIRPRGLYWRLWVGPFVFRLWPLRTWLGSGSDLRLRR